MPTESRITPVRFMSVIVASLVLFAQTASLSAQTPTAISGSGGTVTTVPSGSTGISATAAAGAIDVAVKTGDSTSSGFHVFNSSDTRLLRVAANGDLTVFRNVALNNATLKPWVLGRVVQGTTGAAFFGNVGDTHLVSNGYTTPVPPGWKYMDNGVAANMYMYMGDTVFRTAPSGVADADIHWLTTMTIRSTGNVGIGLTTPAARLHVTGADIPLQIDSGTSSASFPVRIHDLMYSDGVPGYALDIPGNGKIRMNALEIGRLTEAVIQTTGSAGTSPLYLNRLSNNDVVIGDASLTNMRLRVEGKGTSTFAGSVTMAGNLNVTGEISGAKVVNAVYQDVAEWVPAEQPLEAGTVVIVSPDARNHVAASSVAYDTRVAGVVSAQPGVLLGVPGDDKVKVATTGRVLVNVDATAGPIVPGDILVSSDKPGVAMKSVPIDIGGVKVHRPGTLIGKALEPLDGGQGQILVLLSLQ